MKNAIAGLIAALALAGAAAPAAAQGTLPLAFEVRLDAGLSVGDESEGVDTGVGFGGMALLDLSPSFSLYGGISRFEFGLDDFEDEEFRLDAASVGGRVYLGTGGGIVMPYAQFGAVFADGDTGFEAGLGAEYPLGNGLSLTPMARYMSVDDLSWAAVGVGLNLRL
jgi:Outer membrane protein beta-barrel domain